MAQLRVETTAAGEAPEFAGPTDDLVYFLSFAVAERYGSIHDLSGVAKILRDRAGRDALRPLLTFAVDNPADPEDRRDMEAIWQDAAPVAETAGWAATEIRGSRILQQLAAGFPDLAPRLEDLPRICRRCAKRGPRCTCSFGADGLANARARRRSSPGT